MQDSIIIDNEVIKRSSISNITISLFVGVIKYFFPRNETNHLMYDLIFGVFLTYIVDIMFVQKRFNFKNKIQIIPYEAYIKRLAYIFKPHVLYKYIVVMGIGIMINRSIFSYVDKLLKKYNIFQKKSLKKYKDLMLILTINFLTSSMLLNYLKYKWAYVNSDDTHLSIMILSLFSLSVLISVS